MDVYVTSFFFAYGVFVSAGGAAKVCSNIVQLLITSLVLSIVVIGILKLITILTGVVWI